MDFRAVLIELGSFLLEKGEVIASDPCYDEVGSDNSLLLIKEGEYIARVKYDTKNKVPYELTINHKSTPKKKATELIGRCLVDSGQFGFFKADDYRKNHPRFENEKSEAWYKRACRISCNNNKHKCGLMKSNGKIIGAVCQSGFGDGRYSLFAGYNSDKEITALRISF